MRGKILASGFALVPILVFWLWVFHQAQVPPVVEAVQNRSPSPIRATLAPDVDPTTFVVDTRGVLRVRIAGSDEWATPVAVVSHAGPGVRLVRFPPVAPAALGGLAGAR